MMIMEILKGLGSMHDPLTIPGLPRENVTTSPLKDELSKVAAISLTRNDCTDPRHRELAQIMAERMANPIGRR